jgi:hypothetical protein
MGGGYLEPRDDLPCPASPPPSGGIPLSVRVLFWSLVACDLLYLGSVIGLARPLGLRLLVLGLTGPVFLGLMLVIVGWWHRGHG